MHKGLQALTGQLRLLKRGLAGLIETMTRHLHELLTMPQTFQACIARLLGSLVRHTHLDERISLCRHCLASRSYYSV